jgi:catechol 2,3-dioxygenase-like lactoylglutathione lyase family enzyme
MKNLKIVHFGISVADLEMSISWYKEMFDFEEVKQFEKPEMEIKGALLQRQDCHLEILQPDVPKTVPSEGGSLVEELRRAGANHFAVSVEDVQMVYEYFKSKNVNLVTALVDQRFFFCKDPDGTLIEVRQEG